MLPTINPDKSRLKYDTIRMTLEATRSAGCIAPFIVDGGKQTVETKWGSRDFHVQHDNFAKVHCWIDAVDPGAKDIKCDGINILGEPLSYGKQFGALTTNRWDNPQDRASGLLETCQKALLAHVSAKEGISGITTTTTIPVQEQSYQPENAQYSAPSHRRSRKK